MKDTTKGFLVGSAVTAVAGFAVKKLREMSHEATDPEIKKTAEKAAKCIEAVEEVISPGVTDNETP